MYTNKKVVSIIAVLPSFEIIYTSDNINLICKKNKINYLSDLFENCSIVQTQIECTKKKCDLIFTTNSGVELKGTLTKNFNHLRELCYLNIDVSPIEVNSIIPKTANILFKEEHISCFNNYMEETFIKSDTFISISNILNSAELMDKYCKNQDFKLLKKTSEIITENSYRLYKVMNDYFNVSKQILYNVENVQTQDIDIPELLKSIIGQLKNYFSGRNNKKVAVSFTAERACLVANANFTQVTKAFTDIIISATELSDHIQMKVQSDDDFIVLSIRLNANEVSKIVKSLASEDFFKVFFKNNSKYMNIANNFVTAFNLLSINNSHIYFDNQGKPTFYIQIPKSRNAQEGTIKEAFSYEYEISEIVKVEASIL